ncbi:MAG: citryl-CoA lyase [Actinomycetota bacterium]
MTASDTPFWRTAISEVRPNEIRVRGYNLLELIGNRSFGDVVYLLLSGELPAGNEGRMMDALLVSATEHGLMAPSVDATRFVASGGVPLQAAVASGINAMGEFHAGAVDASARLILEADALDLPAAEAGRELVKTCREQKRLLSGFGHKVHHPDPRTARVMQVAEDLGVFGPFCELGLAIEDATEEFYSKRLPMNIDGAMACIMLELGLDPALGKAFYVIGRAPGLVAHAFEEQTREGPYRDIGWENVAYDGPDARELPE